MCSTIRGLHSEEPVQVRGEFLAGEPFVQRVRTEHGETLPSPHPLSPDLLAARRTSILAKGGSRAVSATAFVKPDIVLSSQRSKRRACTSCSR